MIKKNLTKMSAKSQEIHILSKHQSFISSQMELFNEAARKNFGDSDFGIESCDLDLSYGPCYESKISISSSPPNIKSVNNEPSDSPKKLTEIMGAKPEIECIHEETKAETFMNTS